MQKWIIVFLPGSDRKKIGLSLAWDYEYAEYSRASRQDWPQSLFREAIDYAKGLARLHGIEFVPDDDEQGFLD